MELFCEEKIDITVDGKSIVIRDIDAVLNCCSKIKDEIIIQNKKIIIIQTDTSSTKCRCDCSVDLIHTVHNILPGKYKVEIYREELKKFGYPEDRKFHVLSSEIEVHFNSPKNSIYYDFHQTSCKSLSRPNNLVIPKKINLEVFPNPSKSELTIRFNTSFPTDAKFKMYNFIGKEVFSFERGKLTEGIQSFNIIPTNLPSGIYIGKIILSNGSSETVKIIWSK